MYIELKSKRLVLRPLVISDLETTKDYCFDSENIKYMHASIDYSLQGIKEYLLSTTLEWEKENPSLYVFAITLDGHHIGSISLRINEDNSCELGWMINRKFHNQGYATEAAEELLKFAKNQLKINHFIAHCDSENIASSRVMEKIGMIKTGEGPREGRRAFAREYIYELTI